MSVKNPSQPLSKFSDVKNGPGGVKFLSPTSDLETRGTSVHGVDRVGKEVGDTAGML